MSQKSYESLSVAPADTREMLTRMHGTDNESSVNVSESDSESDYDARRLRTGLRAGGPKHYTLAEKLAARLTVGRPDECWLVTGSCNRSGHVKISQGSTSNGTFRQFRAHAIAWEQANGHPVPAGLVVMHTCDQPRCCNPRHLRVGTQADNIHDSIDKGRYNAFGRQKLCADQVRQIRALAAGGELQKSIARQFGVANNTVSAIVHGKTWTRLLQRTA